MSMKPSPAVCLTGLKPTGELHLGTYVGAIRPAVEMAREFALALFVADYHALITMHDPQQLRHLSRSVAAGWLAAGADSAQATLYRQSDVPEIMELAWVLSCVTAKGLLNRAHAYKAARDQNRARGTDLDAGISLGLFSYPVLMAADILAMSAHAVPVGQDQSQHVEYAADIAATFNHRYGGTGRGGTLQVPRAVIAPTGTASLLPGIDGRKMSKSYGNTIPLCAPRAQLQRLIGRMRTDNTPATAPKDPATSNVFAIYEQFAPPAQVDQMRHALQAGRIGWADLKAALVDELDRQLAPYRQRHAELMDGRSELDDLLAAGAKRARARARAILNQVRMAVGIR